MLYEKLIYQNDFPININICNLKDDPIHYHDDIEFVYVLKGEISLRNGYCSYHLCEGDVFTNVGNEVHSMSAISPDNVIAQIHVHTKDLSRYFPDLSKAVYRTYSKKAEDNRHKKLRELLLQLLIRYEAKKPNYKSECFYLMVDLIKHLNKYFNLFVFDKATVVSFDRYNPVAVGRISRIVQYIYQNYARNITLHDLSSIEHLSSYYISHLIKDFTGMNFREFLCFARVEMSEAKLLGSDEKISQIAGDIGFSTAAYYKKFFIKWFGHSPEEHRAMYRDKIKSSINPQIMATLSPNQAIQLLKDVYSHFDTRPIIDSTVSSVNLDVRADVFAKPIGTLDHSLDIYITPEDYKALGPTLFSTLKELGPKQIIIPSSRERKEKKDLEELKKLLSVMGFSSVREASQRSEMRSYNHFASDSILLPIWIASQIMAGGALPSQVFLRDETVIGESLSGQESLMTSNGYKKPSYFAFAALNKTHGNIISYCNQGFIVRQDADGLTSYIVCAFNISDSLMSLCFNDIEAKALRQAINDFRDEFNLSLTMNVTPGTYSVAKYSLTSDHNIFAYLSSLDFNNSAVTPIEKNGLFSEGPSLEAFIEDVRTELRIDFPIKGAGIQLAVIRPCQP